MAHEGDRARITFNGTTVEAAVVVGSENRKSLLLTWSAETALRTSNGGMYVGAMAVLFSDERQRYEDLIADNEVTIEWLED